MRILQIANKAPYPANDGSSIAIYNLAKGFIDNEIELYTLYINTKKHFKSDDLVPEDFKKKSHYKTIYKNTNPTLIGAFINLFRSSSYFVSRFYFNDYKTQLIKTLQLHTFDIIQLEGVFMGVYIPLIKKYSGAKIILRAHNVEHLIWERHLLQEKNTLKKWYLNLQNNRLKKFELKIFNQCDAIVSITSEDEKLINALTKTKTTTCLTGIDLEQYKKVNTVKQENSVFHFASMDWLPNIEAVDWLLENSWSKVIQKAPNTSLILAGRGMPSRFKNLASKNISIIEEVKSAEEFYNTYDIMLVPLLSGSGLRIKLVEGLAYGKAIITTSIGAEGIKYEHNKHLIIANTAQEYENAIIELLRHPEKKKKLQDNARLLAENCFDYKKLARDLIKFYNTL